METLLRQPDFNGLPTAEYDPKKPEPGVCFVSGGVILFAETKLSYSSIVFFMFGIAHMQEHLFCLHLMAEAP